MLTLHDDRVPGPREPDEPTALVVTSKGYGEIPIASATACGESGVFGRWAGFDFLAESAKKSVVVEPFGR
jgi:hypothetical protein